MKIGEKGIHEQNKEIALATMTDSVGWWPTHKHY